MKNENTTEVILLLDGSFTVPQYFYSEARKQVTDIAPVLQLDAEVSTLLSNVTGKHGRSKLI